MDGDWPDRVTTRARVGVRAVVEGGVTDEGGGGVGLDRSRAWELR